jgi:hypothetical protein
MGSLYKFGRNPFQDFLLKSIEFDVRYIRQKIKNELSAYFTYILENVLNNRKDALLLDFEIKREGEYYKVLGKNALSALWLSGILVDNTELIMKNNTFVIGNRKYHFNNKTYELTHTKIYE